MRNEKVIYKDGQTLLHGYLAYDAAVPQPQPAVLVVHDWSGCNDFAKQKAEQLAKLGYVAFAVDMYGEGKTGETKEEKMALIAPLMEDRTLIKQRMYIAFEKLKEFSIVNSQKIAAIGFCFGGLCALDLARSGADIRGVVSFHGLLTAAKLKQHPIKAKILALHGYADPQVKPSEIDSFAKEMTKAGVDWQMHLYGHTMHAFTNPKANDPAFGTVYDAKADHRSWLAMKNFLTEIFA